VNARQRFLTVARFGTPDYIPVLSCDGINGPNMHTVDVWQEEQRFPRWVDSSQRWDEFWGMSRVKGWVPGGPGEAMPGPEVVKRDGMYETIRYVDGRVVRRLIGQTATSHYGMPQFIEFPCKTREDWEEYRDRWVPEGDGVYPEDFEVMVEEWRERDYPLGTAVVGSFSVIRNLFGTNLACKLFYREPDLVSEILDHYRKRHLDIVERLVREVDLDYAMGWEDFCYRNGCLVSPDIIREFVVPHYRKQTDFIRSHGIDYIYIDSDGYVEGVIGLLEEAGINGLQAFEVRAGNDVLRVRENYPRFVIWGGLDKFAMDEERPDRAIGEVRRKVPPMLDSGGYFPGVDHALPPTSFWRTYLYFMAEVHRYCGNPEGIFWRYLPDRYRKRVSST